MIKSLILILGLMLTPNTLIGMGSAKYWSCTQIIKMNSKIYLIVSKTNNNQWKNYRGREKAFEKHLKDTLGDRVTKYSSPMCLDFPTEKAAYERIKNIIKSADKKGFTVVVTRFQYKGEE